MTVRITGPTCALDHCNRPPFQDDVCARHWYLLKSFGRLPVVDPSVAACQAIWDAPSVGPTC